MKRGIAACHPERTHYARGLCRSCYVRELDYMHHALRAKLAAAEEALREARAEIVYWHADMLTPEERAHPRGSGPARVVDKIDATLRALEGKDA